MTILKETPEFWTNAGGYPPALRMLILITYYPISIALIALQVLATLSFLKLAFHQGTRKSAVAVLTLIPSWLFMIANFAILTANNLNNIFHDRPLHFHW